VPEATSWDADACRPSPRGHDARADDRHEYAALQVVLDTAVPHVRSRSIVSDLRLSRHRRRAHYSRTLSTTPHASYLRSYSDDAAVPTSYRRSSCGFDSVLDMMVGATSSSPRACLSAVGTACASLRLANGLTATDLRNPSGPTPELETRPYLAVGWASASGALRPLDRGHHAEAPAAFGRFLVELVAQAARGVPQRMLRSQAARLLSLQSHRAAGGFRPCSPPTRPENRDKTEFKIRT
jgi:hypothetical protein